MFRLVQRFWFIQLALILALVHVRPAAAQEVLPGEANQWFAYRFMGNYTDQNKANRELEELKALGIKNAAVWVPVPALEKESSSFFYNTLIGPFPTKDAAELAVIDAYRKTRQAYIASYMPGAWQVGRKGEVVYLVIGGDYADMWNAEETRNKIRALGLDASVLGKFTPNGSFVWQAFNIGYRVRANAEKIVAKMKAAGIVSAYVQVADWPYLEKLEDARIAVQSKTLATQSKPSSSTVDWDYQMKLQSWESCVQRNSNTPYSSAQVGMGYAKCGDRPLR